MAADGSSTQSPRGTQRAKTLGAEGIGRGAFAGAGALTAAAQAAVHVPVPVGVPPPPDRHGGGDDTEHEYLAMEAAMHQISVAGGVVTACGRTAYPHDGGFAGSGARTTPAAAPVPVELPPPLDHDNTEQEYLAIQAAM